MSPSEWGICVTAQVIPPEAAFVVTERGEAYWPETHMKLWQFPYQLQKNLE